MVSFIAESANYVVLHITSCLITSWNTILNLYVWYVQKVPWKCQLLGGVLWWVYYFFHALFKHVNTSLPQIQLQFNSIKIFVHLNYNLKCLCLVIGIHVNDNFMTNYFLWYIIKQSGPFKLGLFGMLKLALALQFIVTNAY